MSTLHQDDVERQVSEDAPFSFRGGLPDRIDEHAMQNAKDELCEDEADAIEDAFRDIETCLRENRVSTAKGIAAIWTERFDEVEREFARKVRGA